MIDTSIEYLERIGKGWIKSKEAFVFNLMKITCIKVISPKNFIDNLKTTLPLLMCPNRKHRPTSLEIVAMFDSI